MTRKKLIHYVRRQTLKNAERYIVPELRNMRQVPAKGAALALEKQLNDDVQFDLLLPQLGFVQLAACTLWIGCVSQSCWRCGNTLKVCQHSVFKYDVKIENDYASCCGTSWSFRANPVELNHNRHLLCITGPNMGGKSTYIRQTH